MVIVPLDLLHIALMVHGQMRHVQSSVPTNNHKTDVSDTRTPTPPDDPPDIGTLVAPGTALVVYVRT